MEADEPIVPWWLGVVFGLIAWVPWTFGGYLVAVGVSIEHSPPAWATWAAFLLPTAVVGVLLARMGLSERFRAPALVPALPLGGAWIASFYVLANVA